MHLKYLSILFSIHSSAFAWNPPSFLKYTHLTQKDNVLGNERNYSRRQRHKQTTLYTRNAKDGEKEEEDDDNDTERIKTMTEEITIRSKAEVLLYRSTLMIGSVAFALDQLSNSLYGSGLSSLFIEQLYQISHSISTWSILLSALVAPAYLGAITDQRKENEVNNALFLITNEVLPQLAGFAIFFEVLNVVQYYYRNEISTLASTPTFSSMDSSSGSTLDNTTLVFISLLCFREIGFYGASYKAEAVLAILFSVAIALNDFIGLSDIALQWGLSLSLLVLSFAKVFEPIQDDLIPSGSAFFNDEF
jgi:uncharacterized integral membrane protein